MDTPITRAEFNAFKEVCGAEHRRLADEDQRQNRRIDSLEGAMKEISVMSASVQKLAINMEQMCKVQERQGKRLDVLENRDGEMWRKVVGYAVTAVVGAVLGFIFTRLGL